MKAPIHAGAEAFDFCPWSEISDDSLVWIKRVHLWRRPTFKGWGEDDYPEIVDQVQGTYERAEADMQPFIDEARRREIEAAQRRPKKGTRLPLGELN